MYSVCDIVDVRVCVVIVCAVGAVAVGRVSGVGLVVLV